MSFLLFIPEADSDFGNEEMSLQTQDIHNNDGPLKSNAQAGDNLKDHEKSHLHQSGREQEMDYSHQNGHAHITGDKSKENNSEETKHSQIPSQVCDL